MKSYLIIFSLFFSFILFSLNITAKEVESVKVQKVALNYFSANTGHTKDQIKIAEIIPISENNEVIFTIFNLKPQGHIVVANDDISIPVLGYGLNSYIDFEKIPPGLKFLLEEYKAEISNAKKQKIVSSEEILNKWELYSSDDFNNNLKSYTLEDELLETTWGQGTVAGTGYNRSCPQDPADETKTCLVGCSGVALGQILFYWGCRVFPDGSKTYTPPTFSNPITVNFYDQTYNWNASKSSPDDDNAELLYHCAVAVRSNFGSSVTTANIGDAQTALTNYFGFNASNVLFKNTYPTTWVDMLKTEINALRPVYYRGGGHAWVIDGYNSDDKFHCNWGYNGNYQNEFYSLDDLTPHTYNFNSSQKAIMDIYPILDACSGLDGDEDDYVCSLNESYSVSIPASASVQWSKTGNLTQVGESTNTTYTVHATSTTGAYGTITATIKNSQGQTFLVRSKTVWAGAPNTSLDITNSYNYPENTLATDELNQLIAMPQNDPTIENFEWDYGGWYHFEVGDQDFVSYVSVPSYFTYKDVKVRACNTCGESSWYTERFYPYEGYFMLFTPNPTIGETTLSIESNLVDNLDENTEWELEVYTESQLLKEKKTKLKGKSTLIQTAGWQEGVYAVRVKYKDEVLTGKLVVKK